MREVHNISTLIKKYSLENNLRIYPKKNYFPKIQKDEKTALLEKYKGCDESLVLKVIKTKKRIETLKLELSNHLERHNQSFYNKEKQQSLLDLRWLYYYQIKFLELQTEKKK